MFVYIRFLSICALCATVAACGARTEEQRQADRELQRQGLGIDRNRERSSFFDLFRDADSDVRINVNKHLWTASLDVLSFLPLEAADPFSGVITTGWGRVNGASPVYRATVYITSPALDARSLRVALFRRSGGGAVAVSDEVASQIEDSILTRARQLRIAEGARG